MQIVCRKHGPKKNNFQQSKTFAQDILQDVKKCENIFSEMQNICHNVDCRYFQTSENILLKCKILPPPTSTSSSPNSGKKWCAHNLYSLPLPSTLLLDNLSKIIFFFLTGVYSWMKFVLFLPASVQKVYLVPKWVPRFKLAKRRWIHDSLFSLFDIF